MTAVIHFQLEKELPIRTQIVTEANQMTFQEQAEYMLFSKSWRTKDRLFMEAFPLAEDRTRFLGDFTRRLVEQYAQEHRSVDELGGLMIRKLAIEEWFGRIPKSLLKDVDLND